MIQKSPYQNDETDFLFIFVKTIMLFCASQQTFFIGISFIKRP